MEILDDMTLAISTSILLIELLVMPLDATLHVTFAIGVWVSYK